MTSVAVMDEGSTKAVTSKSSLLSGKRKFQAIQSSTTSFTTNKSFKLDNATEADKENVLPGSKGTATLNATKKVVVVGKSGLGSSLKSATVKKTVTIEDKENLPPSKARDLVRRPTAVRDTISTRLLAKLPVGASKTKVAVLETKQAKLTVFEDESAAQKKPAAKRVPLAVVSSSSIVKTQSSTAAVGANKSRLATTISTKGILEKAIFATKEKTKRICIDEEEEEEEQAAKETLTIVELPPEEAVSSKVVDHVEVPEETKKEEETQKSATESKTNAALIDEELEEESEDEFEGEVEDIDFADKDDPQQCADYVDDIFRYLRKLETKNRPRANYLAKQKEVNAKMREVLVDWLTEVATKFRLLPESLFLGVALMDLFFSKKQVGRSKMQLVGIGALLIASKFEEVSCPVVDDFVWISADAYKREEIIRIEKIILEAIGFDLSVQTPMHFLRRFSKAARSNTKTHTLCKYLLELSLMDYNMLKYLPSQVAASAVYVARKMTGAEPLWTTTLEYYTKYKEEALLECAKELNEFLHATYNNEKPRAVVTKYAKSTLLSVATIEPVEW